MIKFFEHLEGLISGNVTLVKTYLSLIRLETRLAGLSVFPLILTVCMLMVLLTAVWLSSMALLTYSCAILLDSLLMAFFLVLFLNLVLLLIVTKYLMFTLRNMSFEKTRAFLFQKKRSEHDELEKTGNGGDFADTTEIGAPKN